MIYNATIYNDSWNTKKLYELGDFSRGKSKHRPRNDPKLFDNGEYPLVQTGDIKAATLYVSKHEAAYNEFGLSQSKLWPTGTLCITIAANIAETGILAYPMCFPDSIVGFTANQAETSEQFMHYIFTYIRQSIQNSVSGSIQDNINIEYLKSLDFKIPEKSYQDKIVSVLSGLDEKIELNSKICSELETMSKTLYDYWFVQFDFPDENGKPYRTSGGEMIWNEQLKLEIPKGWEATRLGNICDFRNGINYDKDVEGDQEYRIINVRNISSASLLLNESELDKINLPSVQADKYLLSSDDIVIARSGTPGATRLLWKINEPTIFCGFIICSTPHEALHKIYLTYCLKRLEGTSATKTGGSILQNVSQDTLKNLFVLIPDREVLRQFNAVISLILEKIHSNIDENNELTKLRDWLLPMLMNGQAWVE